MGCKLRQKDTPRAEKASQTISLIEGAQIYAQLKKTVESEGILDRSYGYYAAMAIFAFGGFLLTLYFIYITSSLFLLLVLGFIFSFFAVQVGGFMHDAGHRAIFKSTKFNDLVGYISGLFLVESVEWWMKTHNMHHANTNEEGEDPDLEIPLVSFTRSKFLKEKGVAGVIKKYQAWTYYPLRALVSLTRKSGSFIYYIQNFKLSNSWKVFGLIVGLIIWYVLPFVLFDAAKTAVVLLSINIPLGLYISNIFAPNHKGMPEIKKGHKLSFLEQQIITSRNVKGGFWTEFFFIGLNYQIEHHLFTNCPRNKLKLITPHVKKLCGELNLEFTEVGTIETNKIIIEELNKVALSA